MIGEHKRIALGKFIRSVWLKIEKGCPHRKESPGYIRCTHPEGDNIVLAGDKCVPPCHAYRCPYVVL